MRTLTISVLATVFTLAASPAAQNLTPDKVLRVHFTATGPFNQVPDALRLNFGLTTVNQAYGTRRAVLFDCDRQLGTYASTLFGNHSGALNLDPGASFKSPTSLWNFDNAGTADFTTIQNGTIRGIIEFSIDQGAMTIPLSQVNLTMIRATSGSGGSVVSPAPIVLEATIAPRLLGPFPGTVNIINTWQVTGATPNNTVFLGIGTQCGVLPVFNTIYDILDPQVFVPVSTDALGTGNFAAFIPPSLANRRLLLQGIEVINFNPTFSVTTLNAHTW